MLIVESILMEYCLFNDSYFRALMSHPPKYSRCELIGWGIIGFVFVELSRRDFVRDVYWLYETFIIIFLTLVSTLTVLISFDQDISYSIIYRILLYFITTLSFFRWASFFVMKVSGYKSFDATWLDVGDCSFNFM